MPPNTSVTYKNRPRCSCNKLLHLVQIPVSNSEVVSHPQTQSKIGRGAILQACFRWVITPTTRIIDLKGSTYNWYNSFMERKVVFSKVEIEDPYRFAEGSFRKCYRGHKNNSRAVFKVFKNPKKNKEQSYYESMETTCIADFLAQHFNSLVFGSRRIEFIEVRLIKHYKIR